MLQSAPTRAEVFDVSPDLAQRVMDCLHERFVLVNQSYEILVINEAALPKHIDKAAVLGRNLFEVYPNLEEQGFKKIIDSVFETGNPFYEFSVPHTTVDGYTGYHNRKIIPLRNSSGTVEGATIVIENVDDQHAAEEHSRLAELEYTHLIETLQLVSFELDARGVIIDINKAVKPVFGFETTDLIGKSFTSCIHPDDVRNTWHVYWQIVNLGKPFGICDNRFITQGGGYVHMRWNIHPLYDERGAVRGCRGVGENITADQTLLQELREEVRLFEETFQAAPGPILVVKNGMIVKINRAFHKMLHVNMRVKLPTLEEVGLFLQTNELARVCEAAQKNGSARGELHGIIENRKIDAHIIGIRIHNAVVVALQLVDAVQ